MIPVSQSTITGKKYPIQIESQKEKIDSFLSRNSGKEVIVVQGLGFVGSVMSLVCANALSKEYAVIGVDLPNENTYWKICSLNEGIFPVIASDKKIEEYYRSALKKNGVDVEFLSVQKKNLADAEIVLGALRASQVPVHVIYLDGLSLWGISAKIGKLMREGKYDLVHSHLIRADVFVALAKIIFFRKQRIISTKHGYEESALNRISLKSYRVRRSSYYYIMRFIDRVFYKSIFISKGLYNLFTLNKIISKSKATIIHYGFKFEDVLAEKTVEEKGPKTICVVGRLSAYKGHRFLLEAMPLILKRYPETVLKIIGWGPEENNLKRECSMLGLDKNIIFFGKRKDTEQQMKMSDVVVLPSVFEGFGIVALEAISVNRPVVTFNVPAFNEIFEKDISGWLARPYSVEDLAGEIMTVFDNESMAVQRCAEAKKKLNQYFTTDRMTRETISVYHESIRKNID